MTPLLVTLFQSGLSILGNAVIAKGKEVIEDKLGVSLEKSVQTEEGLIKLRQLEFQHEQFLLDLSIKQKTLDLEAEKNAQGNVTERWKADMLSDSWLSKNIRPLVLIYLLVTYSVLSTASGFDFTVTQAYVELLAQMIMLVMGAYFAGRTIEKVVDMKERGK